MRGLKKRRPIVAAASHHNAMSMPAQDDTRHRFAPVCDWCGQPLTALRAMRRSVCERATCLQQSDARALRLARVEVAHGLREQQVPTLGAERAGALRVLWIVPHAVRLVDLPADLRARHRAHLQGLVAADGAARTAPADPGSQAGPVSHAEGRLCAWCAGRCCGQGGANHAFIGLPHLRRWQQAHPGRSLQDAATAYAERLPAQHAEHSCMYHGAQGCTLDRAMRSEVCNLHACDSLRDLQQRQASGGAGDWLFVMGARAEVLSTAVCQAPGPAATAGPP